MSKRRPSPDEPIITIEGNKTIRRYGIYRHESAPPTHLTPATLTLANLGITAQIWIPGTMEEIKAGWEAWNAEPQRTLDHVRQHAKSIFLAHAVEASDPDNPPLQSALRWVDVGSGLQPFQLPEDAPPIANDAARVLLELHDVATNSNPGYQLLAAFRLGRSYEKMLVRPVEHRALPHLRKIEREQRKGKKRRADTEPEREKRRQANYAAMNQQVRRREKLSFRRAMIVASSACECSFEAIKQAKPINRWTVRRKRKR